MRIEEKLGLTFRVWDRAYVKGVILLRGDVIFGDCRQKYTCDLVSGSVDATCVISSHKLRNCCGLF